MAKPLEHVRKVIPFPMTRIIQFPLTQLCGCGCGVLLNIEEDSFIRSEETGQWYVDEVDMLNALDVAKSNNHYRYRGTDYWYTKTEFYEEIKAYWVNELSPIA